MLEPRSNTLVALILFAALATVACGGSSDQAAPTPEAAEPAGASSSVDAGSSTTSEPAVSSSEHRLGKPLDHPERYYGLYTNPETPDRQWFVTAAKRSKYAEQAPEVPPGYLAIGAMFADVAPWHMETLSDTEFEQAWVSEYQPEAAAVEFEMASDGSAVAMTFTSADLASEGRLARVGDLPEGWE